MPLHITISLGTTLPNLRYMLCMYVATVRGLNDNTDQCKRLQDTIKQAASDILKLFHTHRTHFGVSH